MYGNPGVAQDSIFPHSRQSDPRDCGVFEGGRMSGVPGTVPVQACGPSGSDGSFSAPTRIQAWTVNPTVPLAYVAVCTRRVWVHCGSRIEERSCTCVCSKVAVGWHLRAGMGKALRPFPAHVGVTSWDKMSHSPCFRPFLIADQLSDFRKLV